MALKLWRRKSRPAPPEPVVRASGGVVRRRRKSGRTEYAVVHRPRYDDWSLPKGKLDRGETDEEAALREVEEETGMRCRIVRAAGSTAYTDRHGRDKTVWYWVMEPLEGRFEPGEEVDALRWLTVDEALALLTYPIDRSLLSSQSLC